MAYETSRVLPETNVAFEIFEKKNGGCGAMLVSAFVVIEADIF